MSLLLLFNQPSGPANYKLTCQAGQYNVTGQQATLTKTSLNNYTLTCLSGQYNLTGQQVTISRNRSLTAQSGSYALNGQSATLTKAAAGAYTLTCLSGSYVISGQSATLNRTGGELETRGGIDPRYIQWWLNKHKKKPVETVEEALEIVEETIEETPVKQQPKAVRLAREDKTLQLFIAKQIVLAQIETAQLIKQIEEDEEEAILALLL